MRTSLFIALILCCVLGAQAQTYDFTPGCKQAYEAILSLKMEEGKAILAQEKAARPDNLYPYFLENYVDFMTIFITEDPVLFKALEPNKDKRLEKLETGNKNSPYHLYIQAEVHLQWAMARIKFEEYLTAFWEVRRAFKLLEENQRKHPNFTPNKKSLGLLHTLIGTIPDNYKWGANLLGLDGTIEQGMQELRQVMQDPSKHAANVHEETKILYTFVALYFANQQEEAWEMIQSEKIELGGNLLNHFVAATVAMRTGRNDEAIRILQNKPRSKAYLDFPYLDHILGLAKLHRLDEDAANYFLRFIKEFKGSNYVKDAYQKVAWHYLIHGNRQQYQHFIAFAKTEGSAFVDSDKQALKEATQGPVPQPDILKIRMLFDGAYYQKADSILQRLKPEQFTNAKDKLEFTYRAGRVYHKWGKEDIAIEHYLTTITNGASTNYYYAANSALQLGLIYEDRKDWENARTYYNLCLSMKDHEYKNSLDQKAKSGLNRIKGK